jgi:hypothetical protein
MALATDQCGGRVITINAAQVLKGDGERGNQNMMMSMMCTQINEDERDSHKSARRKISRELAKPNLDF